MGYLSAIPMTEDEDVALFRFNSQVLRLNTRPDQFLFVIFFPSHIDVTQHHTFHVYLILFLHCSCTSLLTPRNIVSTSLDSSFPSRSRERNRKFGEEKASDVTLQSLVDFALEWSRA